MYFKTPVSIPDRAGVTRYTKNGTEYVRYAVKRKYNPDKEYTETTHKTIGKVVRHRMPVNRHYVRLRERKEPHVVLNHTG